MSLPVDSGKLFAALPELGQSGEQIVELLARPGITIERIVSNGQASPEGFWYDQAQHEWVVVLQGEARLRFADETTARHLKSGDYVAIDPHRRHRVDWTAPDVLTIWLAVHSA